MPIFKRLLALDRHAMRLYRIEDRLYRSGHADLAFAVSAFSRVVTGIEVEPGAELAPGVMFLHGQGTLIGHGARIGDGTTIFQQVTIGRAARPMEEDGYPTIGRNAYVYPHSILLGEISVGDGAKVAAGSVVNKDVPAGAIVAGNPARQIGWVEGYGDASDPTAGDGS